MVDDDADVLEIFQLLLGRKYDVTALSDAEGISSVKREPFGLAIFDHRIRNSENLEEKFQYIRMNPVRRGLVATPGEWPWVWEPD